MRQVLHISDIHFGPHFLPAVAAGVEALIERCRPDLVVIAGDLTQRAKIGQFRDARAFVDRLPVPWIAVPGNHDVPMYRVWERVLAPYQTYQRHFAPELEPVFEDDELAVVGVNTAFNWTIKDGRFTREALRRVERLFRQVAPGKARWVVAHHHLVPPPRFDNRRLTERGPEALRLFAELGVELVFSGHLHQTWIGNSQEYFPEYFRDGRQPTLLLHSGTTTSGRGRGCEKGRNTANWVVRGPEGLTITHLIWDPAQATFCEQSRHLFPLRAQKPFTG